MPTQGTGRCCCSSNPTPQAPEQRTTGANWEPKKLHVGHQQPRADKPTPPPAGSGVGVLLRHLRAARDAAAVAIQLGWPAGAPPEPGPEAGLPQGLPPGRLPRLGLPGGVRRPAFFFFAQAHTNKAFLASWLTPTAISTAHRVVWKKIRRFALKKTVHAPQSWGKLNGKPLILKDETKAMFPGFHSINPSSRGMRICAFPCTDPEGAREWPSTVQGRNSVPEMRSFQHGARVSALRSAGDSANTESQMKR